MARVKFGSLVTEISGSIGGSTFQRNSFGNTLRNKPNPIRSRTAAQLSIRQYMKQAHAGWTALTAAERQRIKRKGDRLVKKLLSLPEAERNYLVDRINQLIMI